MLQFYHFLIKYLRLCMPHVTEAYLAVRKFLRNKQIKVIFLIIRDGNLRLIMARKEGQNLDFKKNLIKWSFDIMSSNL